MTATDLTPALFLTMWAAGLSGAGALVARWRVVGPGFVWLMVGVTALFGGTGWLAGAGALALLATVLVLIVAAWARGGQAWLGLAAASALYVAAVIGEGGPLFTISGSLALGGVTTEMMLGHWYLIDPKLPRWSLHRLVLIGLTGLVLDGGFALVDSGINTDIAAAAYATLTIGSVALMLFVWFALREPGYAGVMAATGLSYLATLTTIGAVVAARAYLDETAPLLGVSILGP